MYLSRKNEFNCLRQFKQLNLHLQIIITKGMEVCKLGQKNVRKR